MNQLFALWLGYTPEAMLDGMTLHDIVFDVDEGAQPYDLSGNDDASDVIELALKCADGTKFSAAITHVVQREANGHIIARAVVHDVTSDFMVKKALQDSEKRFERFFAASPLGWRCERYECGISWSRRAAG